MILDERSELADATALSTAGTGIANVGDVIDLSSISRYLGEGEDLYFVVEVTTAVTSAGSATVVFQLVTDAGATPATDGSATLVAASAAIPKADLIAGYRWVTRMPPGVNFERYMGLQQNVGTAALTAGAVNAFFTKDLSKWRPYPEATN